MKTKRTMLVCLLCLLLTGCFSSKYIGRRQYLFDLPESSVKTNKSCMRDIYFDCVEVNAPFDQLNFLYRISSARYIIDYYNGFLVSPSEQLGSILESRYGNFNRDLIKSFGPKKKLQVKLIELYADYRNSNDPRGVIAMQFVLTKTTDDNKTKVLLDRVFSARIPLREKNTDYLIRAWSHGLQNVLDRALGSLKNNY